MKGTNGFSIDEFSSSKLAHICFTLPAKSLQFQAFEKRKIYHTHFLMNDV